MLTAFAAFTPLIPLIPGAVDGDEAVAEVQALFADPVAEGVEQDAMEGAAVDRELRPAVAGGDAPGVVPDRFTALG